MRLTWNGVMLVCVVAAVAGGLPGCKVTGDPAKVGGLTFRQLERADGSLKEGMPIRDVLKVYKKANKVKLSEATVVNRRMEEWKVEAITGPSTNRRAMARYLYFVDGALMECRDDRWDYRADEALRARFGG